QTEREAGRGDIVATRFLDTVKQASPVALHRSAVSLRANRSPTLREQLEALAIPRTVIWGAETPPLTPPLANPAIRHELIPDAGHVMMIENPEGFADAIGRALLERYIPSEGA
ncbi:MAG TPA: alpha/beta hydrolase, partial [Thermomicrobiales bacterium]|nr:alpha/beta hydrolase [Thermomicrobiales bacterium]